MSTVFLTLCASLIALAAARPLNKNGSVIVGYYAESLCPDCIALSTEHMDKAVKEIGDIFTLDYVPWGNAKLVDGKFECQHGEMECIVNTIDACLLKYHPDRDQFWPFIACMDKEHTFQSPTIAQRCATANKLDWDKIDTCYQGNEGHELELGYYNQTDSLRPPHRYTPWITINGEHDPSAEGEGLIQQICEAYKGLVKPAGCGQ